MKILKTTLLLNAFVFCGVLVSAQSADDIIAKYVEAIGGKEELSKINSLYTESEADMMSMETLQKVTVLNGIGYKMEMEIMGSVMTTCFTDSGGWLVNPMMGSGSAETMPEAQYNEGLAQIFIGGPFTVYAEQGYQAEFLGNETVGSVDAAKVKLTSPAGTSSVYFFDPGTGYIIKALMEADMQGQMVENELTFSDYKMVDGIVLAHTIEMNMGGMFEMTSTVTKVEVNKPVDPAIFLKE